MAQEYLPRTDAGLLSWSQNFADKIATAPDQDPPYGLTLAQVDAYQARQQAYAEAYAKAKHPDTRGGATVLAKNIAKKELISLSRTLAMLITNNPEVTDQQRYELGLTVRDTEPTPIPPPAEAPVLEIVSVVGTRVRVRLHSADAAEGGKPQGVQGATMLSYTGEAAPTDLKRWTFQGGTTKTTLDVEFEPGLAPGTKVWLAALWYNRKAQSGPACRPVSTNLQGGGIGGVSEAA